VRSFIKVGIDPLKGVVGMAALFQAPLLILDQLGGVGKLLARTGSAGAVASVAVVSGAAGNVSAQTESPPVVITVPSTTEPPTTTTTVLVILSPPETPPVTVVVIATPEPATTTTEEPTTTTTRPPPRPARTTTTTTEPPTTTTTEPATTTTTTTTLLATTTTTLPPTTTTTEPPTTTTTLPLPVQAANDSVDVSNGVQQTISPLANDTGPIDVTTLALTGSTPGVTATSNGDGTLTVTVNGGPSSRRSLSYRICSAAGDCSTATITFHIV
jgi:hypothetical protein